MNNCLVGTRYSCDFSFHAGVKSPARLYANPLPSPGFCFFFYFFFFFFSFTSSGEIPLIFNDTPSPDGHPLRTSPGKRHRNFSRKNFHAATWATRGRFILAADANSGTRLLKKLKIVEILPFSSLWRSEFVFSFPLVFSEHIFRFRRDVISLKIRTTDFFVCFFFSLKCAWKRITKWAWTWRLLGFDG